MPDPSSSPELRLAEPVPEDLFRYLLEVEVEKAARLRYRVSVICLAPDTPDRRPSPELSHQIARLALRHLRRTDAATTFADGSVGLLLVDAELQALQRILGRAAGGTTRGSPRFAYAGETVSVSGGAGSYPLTASNAPEVLGQAVDLMRTAQRRGGDRLLIAAASSPRGSS